MIVCARINRYTERGARRAKIYLSSSAVEALGTRNGKIMLIAKGKQYFTSVSKATKRTGLKVYLPVEVVRWCEGDGMSAEAAILRVEMGRVEVLAFANLCRICGAPTSATDGLCAERHYSEAGRCARCGAPIPSGRTLCNSCIDSFAQLCGLSTWLEPEPMNVHDFDGD